MCVSELAGKILNQYHLFVERRFLPLQNRVEKGVAYTGINIEDLRKLPVEFSFNRRTTADYSPH